MMLYIVKYIDVTLSFKVKSFLKQSKKRFKKRPMSRNETFFVRLLGILIYMTPLYADMTIGLLSSIENNSKVYLIHNNARFTCEPFGIMTLEKMAANGVPTECKNAVENYYSSHPHDKQFAKEHLHIQQSYHYEMIKEGCVLYGNGPESYSEMLLRHGLAVIDPAFDNPEWNTKLKRSMQGAQFQKTGMHDTQIQKFCIKEEK
jgi:hypothetical protein